jgi:hypothetical protein
MRLNLGGILPPGTHIMKQPLAAGRRQGLQAAGNPDRALRGTGLGDHSL